MHALPSAASTTQADVVPLWSPPSHDEVRAVAVALVAVVRERLTSSMRVSKLETQLRAALAEAMHDAELWRLDAPDWTVALVAERVVARGPDSSSAFAILGGAGVQVEIR